MCARVLQVAEKTMAEPAPAALPLDLAQLLGFPGVGRYFLAQFSVAQLHVLRRVCRAFDGVCSDELAAMPGPLAIGGYYPGAANASHMNGPSSCSHECAGG